MIFRRLALVIFYFLAPCALVQVRAEMHLTGTLVYGLGKTLYSVDLISGEKKVLVTWSAGSMQDGMSSYDDERILIGGSGDIVEYKFSDGSLRTIGKGDYPLVIPNADAIFFYSRRKGIGLPLVKARSIDNLFDESIVETGPYRSRDPLIAISSDEILFLGADKRMIWRYNNTSGILRKLQLVDCTPLAWRSKTKELLCWNPKRGIHYLVDLDGKSANEIRELSGAVPVLYIEKFDALIINTPAFRLLPPEMYDLSVFYFGSRQKKFITSDSQVAKGSAVWRDR